MNIAAIDLLEGGSLNQIYLYKEGSFWKAYEKSAYLFVTQIREYKTKLRRYKVIDKEMVSIGFPDMALEKIIAGRQVKRSEKEIEIALEGSFDAEAFERWKAMQPTAVARQQPASQQAETSACETAQGLAERVRNFPLANSSPIECMQFVAELQRVLC